MGWKKEAAAYFNFTSKDRMAILVLIVLIMVVWIAPRWNPSANEIHKPDTDTSWFAAARQLEKPREQGQKSSFPGESAAPSGYDRPGYGRSYPRGNLFYFDPNTASQADWEKLGLRAKTIKTIQNFRDRGGRFREAADLKKISGLFPDEFDRLAPFIRIGNAEIKSRETNPENRFVKSSAEDPGTYEILDINEADSTDFIALPGIGSKLANRIITFREKLGGFYRVEQVGETFGLADSVFQRIKPFLKLDHFAVRKINVNTATIEELKTHPYIRYQLANPINSFRNEHGLFEKVSDLKKIQVITDEVFKKISPYLTTEGSN